MSQSGPLLVAAGVVSRDDRILVARRKKDAHLGLLWEFPGGKIEPYESPEECLIRELEEEVGIRVRVGPIMEAIFHRYPERNVLLLFYACELLDGEPRPIGCAELAWIDRPYLPRLNWVPADRPFVQRLATGSTK